MTGKWGQIAVPNHYNNSVIALLSATSNFKYKGKKIICIFQPHRVSRLNDLKKEFCASFKKADSVILCPVYKAGENIKLDLNYYKFSNQITKKSKVQVFFVNDQYELAKFLKQYLNKESIVIGMGAGSISTWIKQLPGLMK